MNKWPLRVTPGCAPDRKAYRAESAKTTNQEVENANQVTETAEPMSTAVAINTL